MTTRRRPRHLEDAEQAALIAWAEVAPMPAAADVEPGSKVGDYLFAVPNGGQRSGLEAKRLKGLGVRAGIPDLFLDLARGGGHGLRIELKRPTSTFKTKREAERAISPEQHRRIERLQRAGYVALVCYGWDEARAVIQGYLLGKAPR